MTLLIEKQTGNYFSFVLNGDTANEVSNDQNRLLTQGSLCNFKTGNGANIIKEQNISFSDITLIAGGTFTFASVDSLWIKLIEVGFFDGLGNGGGASGANRFDELLDTFTYFGHSNEAVVVNASETGLTTIDLFNYSKFVELSDTPNTLVPNKMVVVNSSGTSLILIDQPQQSQQFLNSVGNFNYSDSGSSVSFVAATEKKLTNDTLGSNTDISQSPFGIATVWNTDTNKFDFSQMDIGDTVDIRIDLNLTNAIGKVFLKIGSIELPLFNSTSGIGLASYITQLPINSNAKTNGAEVYIKSSISGTLTVVGFYTRILRKNINVVSIDGGSDLSANITSYDVTVESSTGTNAVIPSATISSAGVMSATDKGVLDGIDSRLLLKADLVNGVVPQSQLPSYVDDVLEFANLAAFPATGEIGKIYIALDSNKQYRWTGSAYIQITNGLIASTNDVPEGSNNLYFLASRVLATILTGLSTVSTSVITATDTVLSALGKLQGQVSINNAKISYTDAAKVANITITQAVNLDTMESDIANNNGKVGITTTQASNITTNNAKISFDNTISTRLANTSGTNTGDQTLSSLGAAPSSGSANYIQNQNAAAQSANMWISGTLKAAGGSSIVGVNGNSFLNILNSNNSSIFQLENNISGNNIYSASNVPLMLWTNGITALTLSNTQAATFASSVTATGLNSTTSTDLNLSLTRSGSGAIGFNVRSSGNFFINNRFGTNVFEIADLGAATFSSSVTATSHVTTGGSATQFVKGDGSLTVGYKVYTALLTQSGTAAPVATVLENTLGGTVVWSRTASAGVYQGTLSNAFINLKTYVMLANTAATNSKSIAYRFSSNIVSVVTLDSSNTQADDKLIETSIEIRVYN